jgi:gliding motility-associated-like protein
LKEIENIDKIIEQGLSDFNPPAPPDAWEAISQQLANGKVPNSQGEGAGSGAGGQATTGIWQSIQSLSIAAKLVVAVVGVGLGIGVFTWVQDAPKEISTIPAPSSELSNTVLSEPSTAAVKVDIEKPVVDESLMAKGKKVNTVIAAARGDETVSVSKQMSHGREDEAIANKEMNAGLVDEKAESHMPNKEKAENHYATKKEEHEPLAEAEQSSGLSDKVDGEKDKPAEANGLNRNEPEFGNAFSPNGDGMNDSWEIRMEKTIYYRLLIYDRKGVLVYESDQTERYWNGSNYKTGVDCEAGSYSYVIEYQFDKADKLKVKRGIINLLR